MSERLSQAALPLWASVCVFYIVQGANFLHMHIDAAEITANKTTQKPLFHYYLSQPTSSGCNECICLPRVYIVHVFHTGSFSKFSPKPTWLIFMHRICFVRDKAKVRLRSVRERPGGWFDVGNYDWKFLLR